MHQIVDGAAVKDGEECRLRFGKNVLEDAVRLDPAAAGSPWKALGERDAPLSISRATAPTAIVSAGRPSRRPPPRPRTVSTNPARPSAQTTPVKWLCEIP